jgi:hypothetical protein
MDNFKFKKWNNLLGWLAFSIAFITFTLTVEPTVSFWDCGEFIATSAKLQLGHPPGAPLFQMVGAFFAMFATDPSQVAFMVNMSSVASSAFTILFMFWSLTLLLQIMVRNHEKMTRWTQIAILGSAFIGVMAFTFSDSFWYNAAESEVYAMATFLIAVMFWAGIRWVEAPQDTNPHRWLLLVALITGFAFGVHLMALLTIPAIGLLYYFKNHRELTVKNFIVANLVSVGALLLVFKIIIPFTLEFFGRFEILMVNTFGLPFNSGTIIGFLLYILIFVYALKYTHKKGLVKWNTAILTILFVLVGFSSWMMLPIRANANPPINENKPSDAAEMLSYYNREQYGNNALFYGPLYSDSFAGLDPIEPYVDKAPNYDRDYENGKYVITNNYIKASQNSHRDHKGFLPRMWSAEHAENYMKFTNELQFKINPNYRYENDLMQYGIDLNSIPEEQLYNAVAQLRGETEKTIAEFRQMYASGRLDTEDYITFLKSYGRYLVVEKPSFIDNLSFMFNYQFGYMYGRYLMWNFVGRQNDNQGRYSFQDGNWISGIPFIDNLLVGPQEALPSDLKNNKARNTYYFLPFILGLIGFYFHFSKDKKQFYALLILFLFTGLILKIYLNERPFEPRERDYALVGSFYVFAMWIGFGVYAIIDTLKKWLAPKIIVPIVITTTLFAAPVLMAAQNWDDHDRSNKYTALTNAKAYLSNCEPNAILFTIGDNYTFPLWYAQEIEGYSTDVRIVNTSLLATDWYIDQMKNKAYESEPLPISFDKKDYVGDKLDYIFFDQRTDKRWDLNNFIMFIKDKDPKTFIKMNNGHSIPFYPTNKLRLEVNKDDVIKHQAVAEKYYDSIVTHIDLDISKSAVYKNRLMMLDIINNNQWKRPIYFSGGSYNDEDYIWLKDYLQFEGLTYKLVPIKKTLTENQSPMDMGIIDTEKMYQNIKEWEWGNGDLTTIYHDPETRKNTISYRTSMARLIEKLVLEEDYDKALEILDLAVAKIPYEHYGYYRLWEPFVLGYYEIGQKEKARTLALKLINTYQEYLKYYLTLNDEYQNQIARQIYIDIEMYRSTLDIINRNGDKKLYEENKKIFNSFAVEFGAKKLK